MTNMPGRLSVHAFNTRYLGLSLAGAVCCLSLLLPQATVAKTSGGATITVWATNGTTAITSGMAASKANGTDFGVCIPGKAYTNTLYVSNDGDGTLLTISSWTTNGPGFTFTDNPSSVANGVKAPFKVIYLPSASGSNTVALVINHSVPGAYTVNLAGSGTVNTPPVISAQPVSAVVTIGSMASLSVSNSGTGPFGYQWLKDGAILQGRTNSTVNFDPFQFTDSGSYSVVITNALGMTISIPASLSVPNAPLRTWGYNYYGQLGNGTNGDIILPAQVVSNVVAAAGGQWHSLFVKADGTLWSMGANWSGQLGNGTNAHTNQPIQVASNVVAVAGGGAHSLFVKADGTLWGMGYNGFGELGIVTTAETNRPVQLASNVVAVAPGHSHSLFVKADGTLWAMGKNGTGQLGNGTTNNASLPVQVASNVVAAAGGQWHSLFVKADGTLWAMGWNKNGQLGNGTTNNASLPVQVASDVVAAASGYCHSLFVKADRTLWTMGQNVCGQLGNGTNVDTNLPVQVASNVVGAAGGFYHSLFVKADGTLWAMGQNGNGALGNGTKTTTNRPVQVSGGLLTACLTKEPAAGHSLAIAGALPAVSVSNRTVTLGQTTNFTASVTGDGPFTYQWQFGDTNIVNATNAIYTILGTAMSDAGNYAVIVAGTYGTTTSTVATLTVNKANQTITSFPAIGNKLTTDTVGLSATASSGLSVTFTTNGGPAIITGGTNLTFSGTGFVSIVASQAGDTDWNAAPNVTNTFTVFKASQAVLEFKPASPQTYATTNALSITGGSGTGAVSYAVISGPGQIVGGTNLMVRGGVGTIKVRALKAQDKLYSAASVTSDVTAAKADQTINFPAIGNKFTTDTVGLSATASSGLSVSFNLLPGPASLTGTNLSFSGTGLVSIVASQAGNTNWNAAPNVTNTFNVVPVNHAPVGTSNTVTTLEDTPYMFAPADFGFTDPNDAPANALAAVMITTVPGAGTLRSGGSVVTNGQRIALSPAGATWTAHETDRSWKSVASSSDGNKLVAVEDRSGTGGQIYTSTDAGATWTAHESDREWTSVASSANGAKLVAVDIHDGPFAGIYTSTDTGATWTARSVPATAIGSGKWYAVASSSDGTKLVVVDNGYAGGGQIFTSTDSGENWTAYETNRYWKSVASSSDGTKLVAVVQNGQIYTSTDSGTNWTARENSRNWNSVASSSDGAKLVAVVNGGQIYTSIDAGAIWTPCETNRSWLSVASSSDGMKLVAVVQYGEIYTSTDAGATWTSHETARNWTSVASSSDGTKLVAVNNGGQIYTSQGGSLDLTFTPATNGYGSPYSSFTFQVQDDGGTTNGGVDLDPTPRTLTINVTGVPDDQTIDFPSIGNKLSTDTVGLSATASSGLSVTFTTNGGPAIITGGTNLIFSGTGSVSIVASQAGDADWNAAPNVTNTFNITLAPPTITAQPVSAVVTFGQSASLSVSNSGTGPFGYQWLKDGVILTGQTNSTLSFDPFKFTNSGSYSVVITNSGGMAISIPASLSVPDAPLRAWGFNSFGQLGNGSSDFNAHSLPVKVASSVVETAAGKIHSLFVKADGTLWAMGYNGFGQLGNGSSDFNAHSLPIQVAGNVVATAGGEFHSLFVKADGTLWAMGYNGAGQLGNGTTNNASLPIKVTSNVVATAAGGNYSLFVKADGTLWAMGLNSDGQLGNGTKTPASLPIKVASNVVATAAGSVHALFVKADGTLWAMGGNYKGQLGNGTLTGTNRPIQVASNVVATAAGEKHSLFVKADGTLWAMGYNDKGQLGDGTTKNASLPVQVASNVVVTAGSLYHSLFVKTDSTLWAMGYNAKGQLGDGTTNNASLPVQVTGGLLAAVMAKGPFAEHSLAIAGTPPSVSVSDRTVTFGQLTNFTASVTAGDGPFTYQWQYGGTNIVNATNATYTISGAVMSDAGSYDVMIASPYGSATSIVATLTVNKANQTITSFPAIGSKLTTDTVGLSATASSSLIVTFTTNGGPAIITGGTNLTFSGAGSVSIVASQAGNTDWNAAPNVTNAFTVEKASQAALVFTPASPQTYATTNTLSATGGSGTGAVTYAVLSGVGELIGINGLRASSGTGMIVVQASKAADELYLLQTTVATVTVTKAMASVVLGDLSRTYDGSGKAATATSVPTNLLVTFTYNGSDAIPTNSGSYAVTGTVMDVMWQGFQTGMLVIARAQDTITFGATNHVYEGTAKPVTAAADSGSSVSLTYAGGLSVPDNAGVYAVTGVVDAANWQATNTAWLTIIKADQVITNFLPADGSSFVLGSGTTVVATAASGLPVSFSNLTPEVTLMLRNDLTFTNPGLARMRASQAGNSNWNAALDVIHSWRIGGLITNVTPAVVNVGGRIQVVVQGIALGNGGDITNVTLAGVEATIITQTLESVTVMANAATGAVAGAVTVVSSTGGSMVMSNAFAYLWFEAPELLDPVSITESNLVARWVPPTNAAACELDVGLDTNFTAYLPGYQGLGVALAQNYTVTGLQSAVWYAIRTFASNTNGYSLPSRTVWVPAGKNTPYETHPPLGGPVSIGAIMEQSLANMFFGQWMEYSVESSDTNVVVASITADSLLRLEPRSPGKAIITVRATEHGTGYTSTYAFEVDVTGVPTVISNVFRSHERWNPRFEQLLKVSNDSLYDAVGVRLLFTNLMAGIVVENRTGTSWDGRPMIEQQFDFSAGLTQMMSIVYLCTGAYRVDQYPPDIELQYILTAWHRPLSGVGTKVKAWMMSDGSGRMVLEFPSEPGGLYAVEYVNDLSESDWIQVPLRLKAGANRTQWIDSGPPATLPVKAGKRFYRVKQIEY